MRDRKLRQRYPDPARLVQPDDHEDIHTNESTALRQLAVAKHPGVLTPGTVLYLQRTVGNRAVTQLLSGKGHQPSAMAHPEISQVPEGIQRETVEAKGYTRVTSTRSFRRVHVANSDTQAGQKALTRANDAFDNGRKVDPGINTVFQDVGDVATAISGADYDKDTQYKSNAGWIVKLSGIAYWQVKLYGGSDGYTLNKVEDKTGDVWVKVFFNALPNACVWGVYGTA